MIFDCPACACALVYNPALEKMECPACGKIYDMGHFDDRKELQEINRRQKAEQELVKEKQVEKKGVNTGENADENMMECRIYTCTACGAQLAVNGVEASTFCAYCGQPTIVFDRISLTKKPSRIIPFTVTRQKAIELIRQRLTKGFFVPKEIKNFEIERVRGIYIPFWLYDIEYSDTQHLKGTVKKGKNDVTKFFFREARCEFQNITLDASKQLNDESSQRLEPYDTRALKKFDSGYLSGFYADCCDVDTDQLGGQAIGRAKELFDEEVKKTIKASDIKLIRNDPDYKILKMEYAMCPAWFLTFRYKGEPYTILVNGQTGKVIGAVPYDDTKVNVCFWALGFTLSFLAMWLIRLCLREGFYDILMGILVGAFLLLASARKKHSRVEESVRLSKLSSTNSFVKNRQNHNEK